MIKNLAKIAVAACLLAPMIATASNNKPTTYDGSSSHDIFSFSLAALSDVKIDYSWSDMLLTKNRNNTRDYDASSLGWILTGTSLQSGVIDDAWASAGTGTIAMDRLAAGSYTLSLNGSWADVTLNGNGNSGWRNTAGKVNLFDGDRSFCFTEKNTFRVTAVTAVPEPESYAMLLAGLGLMGLVARRQMRAAA